MNDARDQTIEKPKPVKSKKLLWLLAGGGILLVVVIAVILLLNTKRPEPATYQQAVEQTVETMTAYSDLEAGTLVQRSGLRLGMAGSNLRVSEQHYQAIISGENKEDFETVDQEVVGRFDEADRQNAKKLVEAEEKLDELMPRLQDDEAQQKYQEYLDVRDELYSDNDGATDLTERHIHGHRIGYACDMQAGGAQSNIRMAAESSRDNRETMESARIAVVLATECVEAVDAALEHGMGDAATTYLEALQTGLSRYITTVRPMIENEEFDKEVLSQLGEEVTLPEGDFEDVEGEGVTFETVREKLNELFDYLIDQRDIEDGYGPMRPVDGEEADIPSFDEDIIEGSVN